MTPDQERIVASLEAAGIRTGSTPIVDPASPSRYFVFVHIDQDSEGRQRPTRATLNQAALGLEADGLTVDFLLSNDQTKDIEAGIRATLIHSLPNDVRNVFFSADRNVGSVWIDAKRVMEQKALDTAKEKSQVFLSQVGITLGSVSTLGEVNTPGKLALLSAIRVSAPLSKEALVQSLQSKGFVVPSHEWLSRKLDALRRSEDVVRLQDATYALTGSALRSLGSERHGRSPDITRLLALARGKR